MQLWAFFIALVEVVLQNIRPMANDVVDAQALLSLDGLMAELPV